MSTAPQTTKAHPQPLKRRRTLWFGVLGGALAWLIHLMGAYVIAEFGCVSGYGHHLVLGLSVVAWMVVALTVAMLLVALAAALVGYRSLQPLANDQGPDDPLSPGSPDQEGRVYTARVGAIMSGLFAFVILFESVPILYYLHGC
jgi:hypothetical protein